MSDGKIPQGMLGAIPQGIKIKERRPLSADAKQKLDEAVDGGKYMLAIWSSDGEKVETFVHCKGYQYDHLLPSLKMLRDTIDRAEPANDGTVRFPS